jgi:hypothetical protein
LARLALQAAPGYRLTQQAPGAFKAPGAYSVFRRKPPPQWACGKWCTTSSERRPGATVGPVSRRPFVKRSCYLPTQPLVAACSLTLPNKLHPG